MTHVVGDEREGFLDPIERISEILFGLIMAVTIVGSLSIAEAGKDDVRTVLYGALGCNIAWGLVDAVMYLVGVVTERTRYRALGWRVKSADTETAHRLIRAALPLHLQAITGPEEIAGMHRHLLALSKPAHARIDMDDCLAALAVFILVVLSTFPVVLPFMFTDDLALAMQASRLLTIFLLFVAGFALGRYAGHARPVLTGALMALLGIVLILAVIALGG